MKNNLQRIVTVAFILFSGFSTFSVSAQEISFVGGMNFSNMVEKDNKYNYTKEENYKSRVGGHIGILFGFNAGEKVSLQTGLLLSTRGFKIVEEDRYEKEVEKINLSYIEVPFLVSYNHKIKDNFKVYGGVGPVLGVAIGGKDIEIYTDKEDSRKSEKSVDKMYYGNHYNDDFKRLDLGLMVQAGVQYDKYKLGLFFNHGLLNISSNNYFEIGRVIQKNKVFGISVAYVIDLKK